MTSIFSIQRSISGIFLLSNFERQISDFEGGKVFVEEDV